MAEFKSEIRDGMRIDWDVPIVMDDGVVLRADVYRPTGTGTYPVILSYGPYGRGCDYKYPGGPGAGLGALGSVFTGVSSFQHNDLRDRPPGIFGQVEWQSARICCEQSEIAWLLGEPPSRMNTWRFDDKDIQLRQTP